LRELVKPQRKCGMAIHLKHKSDKGKHMVIGALCGSWKCPVCGVHLRKKWVDHLTAMMDRAAVYVSLVGKSHWGTVSKRIARADCQFATIEQVDGLLMVFTTCPLTERINPAILPELLTKAINGAITDRRPVHTSRNWGLPKTAPKMSDWERVSKLPITVDEAVKSVEAAGLDVVIFWDNLRLGFVVELLGTGWDGDGDRFTSLLSGKVVDA